jgi:uncharacterized protein (DUF1778 family)
MAITDQAPRETKSIRFSEREKALLNEAARLYGRSPAEFCRIATVGEAILIINQFGSMPDASEQT